MNMDAMVLSAGAGKRMRPLTENTPKPLLQVGEKRLIEYLLDSMSRSGISNVVINTSYRAESFIQALGDGESYGLNIEYSHEGDERLDTGGGILNALPLIESDPFLVVNGDIWTDFPFESLELPVSAAGCLVLVDNPAHNTQGDFALVDGEVQLLNSTNSAMSLTYSGMSILRKSLFSPKRGGTFPLRDLFVDRIERKELAGLHYRGDWMDIGTPDRLQQLDALLRDTRKQKPEFPLNGQ